MRIPVRLGRHGFWATAAFNGHEIIGGITAYGFPLTRSQKCELFIYDIAVHVNRRRKGIGRKTDFDAAGGCIDRGHTEHIRVRR